MKEKKGLTFAVTSKENEVLGREFFASPEEFARKRGLSVEDFLCPDEAHAAFKRGYAFAAEAEGRALKPTSESMKELGKLATKHFGENFKVAMIPFGLQFRENASLSFDNTGSGTITFLDGDGDIDDVLLE
jgi:hypothetical protein